MKASLTEEEKRRRIRTRWKDANNTLLFLSHSKVARNDFRGYRNRFIWWGLNQETPSECAHTSAPKNSDAVDIQFIFGENIMISVGRRGNFIG